MNDLYYWIALRFVFGIGNINYKNLIKHFGSPEKALQATAGELEQVEGITCRAIESIRKYQPGKEIEHEIDLIDKKSISIITLNDPAYPENLKKNKISLVSRTTVHIKQQRVGYKKLYTHKAPMYRVPVPGTRLPAIITSQPVPTSGAG